MADDNDTNVELWKSEEVIDAWTAAADEREKKREGQWHFMGELLPYETDDAFRFLDLGAGTGAASWTIFEMYPKATATLADFSLQMMRAAETLMSPFTGRYRYVEFDMSNASWPDDISDELDAVVTSLCIHHMPDDRKQGLFREILDHLAPGGWYLNYDPVTAEDALVESIWERVNDRSDPEAQYKREHRSALEAARYENHIRYMIPLSRQLDYLRNAGFAAIDVYWKQLDYVIYGGMRPA